MQIVEIDRWLANSLPGSPLKDIYPRIMRRLTERGLLRNSYVRKTDFGFLMEVDRLDAIKWCIHYFGAWEPQISAAFQALLSPAGVAIDIGGNIGYHALLAAQLVGKRGRVLTFEPASTTFAHLARNVALNGFTQIEAHQVAVSNSAGEVILHLPADNQLGDASLLAVGTGATETVKAISFADIAEMVDPATVDLIKIDVEGAEAMVVEGMQPYLDRLKPSCAVFLELRGHEPAVLEPFERAGFKVREIPNEYNTRFYRSRGPVSLRPYWGEDRLADVILCRDERVFERIARRR